MAGTFRGVWNARSIALGEQPPMRVLLVGPPGVRDSLRAQLADTGVEIAGEFPSADEARRSGVAAEALLSAVTPAAPAQPSTFEGVEEALTPREIQVLELLAEGLA